MRVYKTDDEIINEFKDKVTMIVYVVNAYKDGTHAICEVYSVYAEAAERKEELESYNYGYKVYIQDKPVRKRMLNS